MLDERAKAHILNAVSETKRILDEYVDALKHNPMMTQIIETHHALNRLEDMVDEPKTSLAAIFGLQQDDKKDDRMVIQVDEFFGLGPLEAAKRFLKKKGRACELAEIISGIQAGGGRVESKGDLKNPYFAVPMR